LDFVDVIETTDKELHCRVAVPLYDQSIARYELQVQDRGEAGVAVSERIPGTRLPVACPERHINGDSSFCIEFKDAGDGPPRDSSAAIRWWALLHGFLKLQEDARLRGRWPERYSWRHGDAAIWQARLEKLERDSDPRLVAAVRDRSVQLAPGKRPRLARRRRPCPCGSGERILDCHEKALWQLLKLRESIERAEDAFWEKWTLPCCGTMKNCRIPKRV